MYTLHLIKHVAQKTQQLLISIRCNSSRGLEKRGALRLLKETVCGHAISTRNKSRGICFPYANKEAVELLLTTVMSFTDTVLV